MLPLVRLYGTTAGPLVAIPMVVLMVAFSPGSFLQGGALYGYLTMIAALTTVFLGIKHYRDNFLGGVIKFGPALLVGLGISGVASLLYAIGWEISIAWTGFDFAEVYSKSQLNAAHARGASEAELQKMAADAQSFAVMYGNPLYRVPISFIEMFPVGVLISLVSAGILRNSRVLSTCGDQ